MSRYLVVIISILALLSGCSSNRILTTHSSLPEISKRDLLHNIDSAEFEASSIYVKKGGVTIEMNGDKKSATTLFKVCKDQFVQFSIKAPLGIELMRVVFTPDSIKAVDYYNKRYLLTDYKYLSAATGVDLKYKFIEDLLSNQIFITGEKGNDQLDKYKMSTSKHGYLLSKVEERDLGRKIKKFYKKQRKNKSYILLNQQVTIDPYSYRPLEISVVDFDDDNGFCVSYHDFETIDQVLFPMGIAIKGNFFGKELKVDLSIDRVSLNEKMKPFIRIPAKYTPIQINIEE